MEPTRKILATSAMNKIYNIALHWIGVKVSRDFRRCTSPAPLPPKLEMYPYAYIYRGKKTILIWQTNGIDTFRAVSDTCLLQSKVVIKHENKNRTDASKVLWSEYSEMDFDKFWAALRNLRAEKASSIKTCSILLEGWNFIEDVGRTFNLRKEMKRLRSRPLNKAYKKLFCGCNLPPVTPEGKSYSPLWIPEEISAMRSEFRALWLIFRKRGYIQP